MVDGSTFDLYILALIGYQLRDKTHFVEPTCCTSIAISMPDTLPSFPREGGTDASRGRLPASASASIGAPDAVIGDTGYSDAFYFQNGKPPLVLLRYCTTVGRSVLEEVNNDTLQRETFMRKSKRLL